MLAYNKSPTVINKYIFEADNIDVSLLKNFTVCYILEKCIKILKV